MATWSRRAATSSLGLKAFAARYADAGLVVLAVDVREDATTGTRLAHVHLGASAIVDAGRGRWGVMAGHDPAGRWTVSP